MVNLLDFLVEGIRYYPIYTSLSSCLKIAEIVALTRTCKTLSNFYQELLAARRWDIDRDLGRFVDDPCGFRAQLKKQNAYLSGEFAYRFFKNETSDGTPRLDVIIHAKDRDAFMQYLRQVEGYEIQKVSYDIADFHGLIRRETRGTVLSCIDITTTRLSPLVSILLGKAGSINIMGWNKAFAIFPHFDHVENPDRSFICLRKSADYHLDELLSGARMYYHCVHLGTVEECVDKDRDQRKIASDGKTDVMCDSLVYKHVRRKLGDRLTWTISFDTTKVIDAGEFLDVEPPEDKQFRTCQIYYRKVSGLEDRGRRVLYKDAPRVGWVCCVDAL